MLVFHAAMLALSCAAADATAGSAGVPVGASPAATSPAATPMAATATPGSRPADPKAAVPRVLVLETRADERHLADVRSFGDLFAAALSQRCSAEIIAASSVRDRLAVVADKTVLGCDETTCMTEIAGALDARYVVASRASEVGGRWLMRVELFDSQDLKVVAQVSATSDGVSGLAAQAERLADDLLAQGTVLPRRSAKSAPTSVAAPLPPPDRPAGSPIPWVVAGLASAGAVAALIPATLTYVQGQEQADAVSDATAAYEQDPSVANRKALRNVGQELSETSLEHTCVFGPLSCLSPLLCGVAGVSGVIGILGGNEDKTPEENE